jgi:phospholipid transport system substrate-binding protein
MTSSFNLRALLPGLVLGTTMLLGAFFSNTAHATVEEARSFVTQLGDRTLAIIANTTLPTPEKENQLTSIFTETIDTEWIAKFVLGRYWRTATPAQQQQYLALYKKFLISSYVPNFREYTGEKFTVSSVSQLENDEYLVQTQIIHPNKPSTRVDYRLRKNLVSGSYKIYDIVAEGVSLITTQRSEFGSIAARDGVDVLIKKLEMKINNPGS